MHGHNFQDRWREIKADAFDKVLKFDLDYISLTLLAADIQLPLVPVTNAIIGVSSTVNSIISNIKSPVYYIRPA